MNKEQKRSISFYDNDKSYYEFTNFFPCEIITALPADLDDNGKVIGVDYLTTSLKWKSSEHLFHALKFTQKNKVRKDLIELINQATSPRDSRKKAKEYDNKGYNTQFWWFDGYNNKEGGYCIRAMKWVVREKFFQNAHLKKMLWETGTADLIEDSGNNDKFWGNGVKGNGINYPFRETEGKNWLGKILMEIRAEIIQEKGEYIPETKPEQPTSPETPKTKEPNSNQEDTNNTPEKNQSENEPDNNSQTNQLPQAQIKAIAEITTLLNQEPKITDNELDYYQNWREILKKFTDLDKIEIFKNDLILVIQSKKKNKQTSYELRDTVQGAQGKTGEELREKLKKAKKNEGEKVYEEQREKVEELAQKSAQEDPESYRKMAVNLIKESLETNTIKETELENDKEIKTDWEKLKKGKITQPEKIISAEKKITKKVGQIGAQKRFDKLVEAVNQALKSGKEVQLKSAAAEIEKFISSSNVYNQALYSQQVKTIKELQLKLENYSTNHTSANLPTKFPWKIVVPVSLLVILVAVVVAIRKKRLRKN